MASKELWRGKGQLDLRSQLNGAKSAGKEINTFSSADLKTKTNLENGRQNASEARADRRQHRADQKLVDNHNKLNSAYQYGVLKSDLEMQALPKIMFAEGKAAADQAEKILKQFVEQKGQKALDGITEALQKRITEATSKPNQLENQAIETSKVDINNQIKTEVATILKATPESILLGGITLVALFVIRNLPDSFWQRLGSSISRKEHGKPYKALMFATILSILLAACSTVAGTPNPEVPPGGGTNPQTGETTGLPAGTEDVSNGAEAATNTPASPEQISKLSQQIDQELDEVAQEVDLITKMRWEATQQGHNSADILANELTSPLNPEERVIAKGSYTALLLPSGHAGLKLIVDSTWGKANEVFFFDTGADKPMVVSLRGGLQSGLGLSEEQANQAADQGKYKIVVEEVENGQKTVDNETGEEEKLWFATIVDAATGETKVVVDSSKSWTKNLDAAVPLPAIDVMANIAQGYLDGTISKEQALNLSFEEQKDFAILYCDKKNEKRGANPIIFTDRNGDKFYVDPVTLDFAPINDGSTAEQQTIKSCIPKATDKDGFSWVKDHEEWVRIEGSDKIQFNFDEFAWPVGEKVNPKGVTDSNLLDLTIPEYMYKKYGEDANMVPIFFLGKEHGQTDIAGHSLKGTLLGYVITENDPFSVTPMMMTGAPILFADNLRADNPGDITQNSDFYKAIERGQLLYMMYEKDQTKTFADTYPGTNGQEVTSNYDEGLAPSGQSHDIVTGETDSNDLALIEPLLIVEASE